MLQTLQDELCIIASFLPIEQLPNMLLVCKTICQHISKQGFSYLAAQLLENKNVKYSAQNLITQQDTQYFNFNANCVSNSMDVIKFLIAFGKGFAAKNFESEKTVFELQGRQVKWNAHANPSGFAPFQLLVPRFSKHVRVQMELCKSNIKSTSLTRVGVFNLNNGEETKTGNDIGCGYSDNGFLSNYEGGGSSWLQSYNVPDCKIVVEYESSTNTCNFYNNKVLQGSLVLKEVKPRVYFFANIRVDDVVISINRVYMEYVE